VAKYLTTAEAADILGLDQRGVRELCKKGVLSGAKKDQRTGTWLIPYGSVVKKQTTGALPEQRQEEISRGDTITVGDVSKSNVAVGRGARVTVSTGWSDALLEQQFQKIYERIEERPADADVDKKEISSTVESLQSEVSKGENANPNKVERWLKTLAEIAPDILDVVLAAMLSPASAISTVLRKIAEKARLDAAQ